MRLNGRDGAVTVVAASRGYGGRGIGAVSGGGSWWESCGAVEAFGFPGTAVA
jgi:hypothetical protein